MADPFTQPLRLAVTWIPADSAQDDVEVADKIVEWHIANDELPAPRDEEFAAARWEMPAGTSFGGHPDLPYADRIRVVLPSGDRYELTVDREGDLRGESMVEIRYYGVRAATIPSRHTREWEKPEVRRG